MGEGVIRPIPSHGSLATYTLEASINPADNCKKLAIACKLRRQEFQVSAIYLAHYEFLVCVSYKVTLSLFTGSVILNGATL